MGSEIVPKEEYAGVVSVREQANTLQYLMKSVLRESTHYGVVKGAGNKPSLLLPGAEKICQMFGWTPFYTVKRELLPNGHREYTVHCELRHYVGSEDCTAYAIVGTGDGTCTTMESKYRYRNEWRNGQKTRVENPDIADCYNTVLKMAEKRAFVGTVKCTAAASDIFTQDVEDMPDWMFESRPAQNVVVEKPESQRPQISDERKKFLGEYAATIARVSGMDIGEVKRALNRPDIATLTDEQLGLHCQAVAERLISQAAPADDYEDGYVLDGSEAVGEEYMGGVA